MHLTSLRGVKHTSPKLKIFLWITWFCGLWFEAIGCLLVTRPNRSTQIWPVFLSTHSAMLFCMYSLGPRYLKPLQSTTQSKPILSFPSNPLPVMISTPIYLRILLTISWAYSNPGSNLSPLWQIATLFSGQLSLRKAAVSSPVGPAPTQRMDFEALMFSLISFTSASLWTWVRHSFGPLHGAQYDAPVTITSASYGTFWTLPSGQQISTWFYSLRTLHNFPCLKHTLFDW